MGVEGRSGKTRAVRRDIALSLCLFFLALAIRLANQQASEIGHPIQKDARQYFAAAYNVVFYGVYATTMPEKESEPPHPDFRRPPGYPLFLMPFMATSPTSELFLTRTTTAQAFLGSFTVLLIFGISRLFMGPAASMAAGALTALCPHLVALDHFILSESLFTVTIVLGVFLLTHSLKRRSPGLSLAAGMVLGFAVLVRPIAMALGPWLALVLFAPGQARSRGPERRKAVAQCLCLMAGWLAVYSPYLVLRNAEATRDFTVSDQSVRHRVVGGMDVGMKSFMRAKTDAGLRRERDAMARDPWLALEKLKEQVRKDPLSTLGWYLGGKVLFMWRWNNMYHGGPGGIGDVYHYPMVRRGFHENAALGAVHGVMKALHWPLYGLTLLSPVFLFLGHRRGEKKILFALPSAMVFLYVAAVLTVLAPMPRYAIPVRPFSYALAVFSLWEIVSLASRRIGGSRSRDAAGPSPQSG